MFECSRYVAAIGIMLRMPVCSIVIGTTTGRITTTTTAFGPGTISLFPDIPDGKTGDIGSSLSRRIGEICRKWLSSTYGERQP
jgi:hypothetical protein